jgi:hypothetical protein
MGDLEKTLAKMEETRVGEASKIRFWSSAHCIDERLIAYSSIKANPESKASPIARVVDSSWCSSSVSGSAPYTVDTPLDVSSIWSTGYHNLLWYDDRQSRSDK